MAEATEILLMGIVAPVVSGLVLFFVGLFVGRRLERKDRWRQDDRTRIYEPLHIEVNKLLSSEESSHGGFNLNTPDTQVLDDIVNRGLLVQPRHRALQQDVEKLGTLTRNYRQRSYDFNIAANKALGREAVKTHLDAMKADTALYNAVVGLSQEAFIERFNAIRLGKSEVKSDQPVRGDEMFQAITTAVQAARDMLRTATDGLLSQGRAMKSSLESALQRGKFRGTGRP